MHRIIRSLLLLMQISLTVSSRAQELVIGDRLPDAVLPHVINDPDSVVRLSDYRGKLLILDFWSTTCKACVEAFPKMDSLQEAFSPKIQILLVCREPREKIETFFQVRKKLHRPRLPMVTADTVLHARFPHASVPHHVWISEEGTVLAITQGFNTNAVNIARHLAKEDVVLTRKKETQVDWSQPFLVSADSQVVAGLRAYSYLMPAIDTLYLSMARRQVGGSTRFNWLVLNNMTILALYQFAYGGDGWYFNEKNTVLEVRDLARYIRPTEEHLMGAWEKKNHYLYEIRVPPARAGDLNRFIQEDLYRSFGLKGHVEKRRLRSLVLVRKGKADRLQSAGGTPAIFNRKPPADSLWVLRNQDFRALANRVKIQVNKLSPLPFIDATGYTGRIDAALLADAFEGGDLAMLREELNKYGLDLVEKKQRVEVLVLRED